MSIISISNRKTNLDYMLFLIFFFNGTGINRLNTTDISLVLMSLLGAFYIIILKKYTFERIFYYVIIYWLAINILSVIFLGIRGFSINTLGGSILKLFIGYSFMKISKENFVKWYEQTVFILTIISIFFFIIQLYNFSIFYSFPFNFVTEGERQISGDWNGIIFNFNARHPFKNSGFGGEPGTFGYYIGLAMIFNLILNKGKTNKKFFIFLIIGLTTMSTTYYLSLLLFFFYFLSKGRIYIKIIFAIISIPIIISIYNLPFMGEKISRYNDETANYLSSDMVRAGRINRWSVFIKDLHDTSKYPLGFGINESKRTTNIYGQVIDGTNGLSRIAILFGLFGFFYFIYIYFKLFKKISSSMKYYYLFPIILFLYIGSNPMERDYYAMGLFWLYFILKFNNVEIKRYQLVMDSK